MSGHNGNGLGFYSYDDMWSIYETDVNTKWYGVAKNYWDSVESTVDGMLGGFAYISDPDIEGSVSFLERLIKDDQRGVNKVRALDVGAGIGRVTNLFLSKFFSVVDVMEQNENFLNTAKSELEKCQIGHFYLSSMQDFVFEETYDIIWIQWVIIYLHDQDFYDFILKCKNALNPGGMIVIKENITRGEEGFILDEDDSSLTRSDDLMKSLISKSGCLLMEEKIQDNFPDGLYPVKMYAFC